jgi:hypothetical protein
MVDGEPVLTNGEPALLFLRKLQPSGGAFEVSARAQGQYPIANDEIKKTRKLMRSANLGVILPPKPVTAETAGQVQTQSTAATTELKKVQVRLAQDVIHDRALDDAVREIATTWQRLHPRPAK